jgi:hypothetical protein
MFNSLRIGDKAKAANKFTPVHPDRAIGKTHGISLMLHGKHSPEYRNAIADMLRRSKKGDQSFEDTVEESAKLIGACCESYEGGDDKKFDRKALIETIKHEDYRWLRLQAEKFMQDDTNFF